MRTLTRAAYDLLKGELVGFGRKIGTTTSGKDIRATSHSHDSFVGAYKRWSRDDAKEAATAHHQQAAHHEELHRKSPTKTVSSRGWEVDVPRGHHGLMVTYHKHMATAFARLHDHSDFAGYAAHNAHGAMNAYRRQIPLQEGMTPYKGKHKVTRGNG